MPGNVYWSSCFLFIKRFQFQRFLHSTVKISFSQHLKYSVHPQGTLYSNSIHSKNNHWWAGAGVHGYSAVLGYTECLQTAQSQIGNTGGRPQTECL